MHKVFFSCHHDDQCCKDLLPEFNEWKSIDTSVDTGEIPETLPGQTIRQNIRDKYLRDSSVTIVLVGQRTRERKHVDWEIYSSMYDGEVKKKAEVFPETTRWEAVNERSVYERR